MGADVLSALRAGRAATQSGKEQAGEQQCRCTIHRLGRVKYSEALEYQTSLATRRKLNEVGDALILLEHFPVITWGRNSKAENLLSSPELLTRNGIDLVQTNRGGDITFHGPGQLVAYPILRLDRIRKDVVWYVRTLEEIVIRTLGDVGADAFRKPRLTGVWVERAGAPAKVAAIGVHISRWVTSHGLALNIETDLRYYRHIVPCGIAEHPVTSLREVLGCAVDRRMVEDRLVQHFGELFDLEMVEQSSQHKFTEAS
jgi:lipoyl(octanoyl) transferase